MKAIVYTKYGPPDVLPKNNEVLIKIFATTVTSGDARLRRADPFLVRLYFGFWKPKKSILGVDLAGVIESVGEDVKLFKEGDEVFGSTFDHGLAAHAEYKCLPENAVLTTKPKKLSFEESVAVFFGGHTSLHYLKKGNIKKGQKVLI